jgi:putative flippase GtrA
MSRSFAIFCCMGVLNTLINYVVFMVALRGLQIYYPLAGAMGFLSGAVTGFFLNRAFSFKSQVSTGFGLTRYLLVQVFCLGVHSAAQMLCVQLLSVPQGWSQLPGIVVTTFLNYNLSKRFVFARKEDL